MDQGSYLLGIDIGGTGAKVGVFALDGTPVGTGYGEYRMISNVPGQAEHDAESSTAARYWPSASAAPTV
jgi:sugar (pentulose or hexulose) kinase